MAPPNGPLVDQPGQDHPSFHARATVKGFCLGGTTDPRIIVGSAVLDNGSTIYCMFMLYQRGRPAGRMLVILTLLLGVLAACGTAAAPTQAPVSATRPTVALAPTATLPAAATMQPSITPLLPTSEPGAETIVEVGSGEFTFDSTLTTFTVATPYRFVVTNTGMVPHEWLIEKVEAGAESHEHTDHADLFGSISVDELGPGMTATREVVFSTPGVYEFACRVAGHYEAGMRLTIEVTE